MKNQEEIKETTKEYVIKKLNDLCNFKRRFEIPQEWKISRISDNIRKYEIGKIKVKDTEHKVNVTIIKDIKDVQVKDIEKIK